MEKEVKTEKLNSKCINPTENQSLIFQLFNNLFFVKLV